MITDTIAAIATPPGKSAVAVIRLSGPESITIADGVFSSSMSLAEAAANRVLLGTIYRNLEKSEIIDQVLMTKFLQPHSYTGEDVVEISCHGGAWVVHEVIETVLQQGARLASPGEFTKRAFLNGKIDLTQAEAIGDIINAQTMATLRMAQQQRRGRLSHRLEQLSDQLKKQLVLLEIELDFSEEDIHFAERNELITGVEQTIDEIFKLSATFRYGKVVRDGVQVALVGKPNVGKSSVLNRLLEEDRAIVSVNPGTTRDSIEEALDIGGVCFKVTDTAGIRRTEDQLEQQGVNRTQRVIDNADLVLFIIDAAAGIDGDDIKVMEALDSVEKERLFLVVNKIDVTTMRTPYFLLDRCFKTLNISAKTGHGFDDLERMMLEQYNLHDASVGAVINKIRHLDALKEAKLDLDNALNSLKQGMTSEFVSLDLRSALDHLAELTGQVTTEEILNDIFSNFCIGK